MKRLSWFRSLLVIILAVTSFRSAIADWNDVPTGSMKPTILEGDRVFVNKLAYDLKVPFTRIRLASWAKPARRDVVVFWSPIDSKRMIKRVVGVPGDVVLMINNRLYINGEPAMYESHVELTSDDFHRENEPHYMAEETFAGDGHPIILRRSHPGARPDFGPVTVPSKHYFVLGDNRDDSMDSRWFGFVPRAEIVGKAEAIALSVNPQSYYKPRWKRFLTPLP